MLNGYYRLFLFSVFISAVSQIILKISANQEHKSKIAEYLNPRVIGAYSFFLISTVLSAISYRGVPLSIGPALECTGYVYIAVLSVLILKEKISKKKILGNVLIIAGIMVCALL